MTKLGGTFAALVSAALIGGVALPQPAAAQTADIAMAAPAKPKSVVDWRRNVFLNRTVHTHDRRDVVDRIVQLEIALHDALSSPGTGARRVVKHRNVFRPDLALKQREVR